MGSYVSCPGTRSAKEIEEWVVSSDCTRHRQVTRLEDTCMVKFTADSNFDINYRPTFQTLFSDYETMLYDSFAYDCQGRQLPVGIFALLSRSCHTLKSLRLEHLPEGCRICIYDLFRKFNFNQYSSLEELVLSRRYKDECYITLGGAISLPPSIKILTLYGIGLVSVPQTVNNLQTLTHLNIANNVITNISCLMTDSIGKNLSALDASENSLTFIPESIEKLTGLTFLSLSHNCIKKFVPESISRLTDLTELSLAWNRIENLPITSIMALPQLRSLDLSYNKLKVISQNLCFHSSLAYLYLSGNEGLEFISEPITEESSSRTCLMELDVSSTAMVSIPAWFRNLDNLCILRCNDNNLRDLDILTDLKRLEVASFSCNNLGDCSKILEDMRKAPTSSLKSLDLSYNNNNVISDKHEEETFYVNNTLILMHHRNGVHCQPKLFVQKIDKATKETKQQWLCCRQ